MNKFISKNLIKSNNLLISLTRWVTYSVSPTGEKVYMTKLHSLDKPGRPKKKEKWQRVAPMGYEPQFKDIKRIESDPRLESDPFVAKSTAFSKLESMKATLRNRGFCRETKPYNPPQNVNQIIENICRNVFSNQIKAGNWSDISFKDPFVKYKFLNKCGNQLNYEIPNSMLYLMRSVSDVLKFYSTPIRGITSYDQMVKKSDELPQNLHVIGEPVLYNPENDTFFGGINAYPFTTYKIRGLRARKKYPNFKSHFVWPDV